MHGIIDVEEPDAEGLEELLPPKKWHLKKECKALRNILLEQGAGEHHCDRRDVLEERNRTAIRRADSAMTQSHSLEALAQALGTAAGEQSDPLLKFKEVENLPTNNPPDILNFGTTFQDFAILNGAYKPDINMKLGKYYRLRLVNTMIMRWLDISIRKK